MAGLPAPGGLTALLSHLGALIRAEGPLSVARYMAECATHPAHGYYMRADPFGEAGDFTTAPEISQMFGEMLGLWCALTWQAMDRPPILHMVELGPGRGTLMADLLRATARVPGFNEAAQIHLVEVSPILAERQRRTLDGHEVTWHRALETVPGDGPVLLVANEFFDALPVHQLVRGSDGWHERLVDLDPEGGALRFVVGRGFTPLAALLPPACRNARPGDIAEICPAGVRAAAAVAGRVTAQGGAGLIVDFGRAESGCGASLQAVRRHGRHDPLAAPGAADLAAHVDFPTLLRAAGDAGARSFGPIGQGSFLTRMGIDLRARQLAEGSLAHAEAIAAARERLVEANAMGELFKAVAFVAPGMPPPPGFEATEMTQAAGRS